MSEVSGPTIQWDDDALFSLPKTRLRLFPDRLVRTDEADKILFTLPLTSVEKIAFRRPFNWLGFLFVGLGVGLAVMAYIATDDMLYRCLLGIGSFLSIVFGIMGIRGDSIVLTTASGDMVVSCAELTDDVATFVVGVQEYLGRQRSNRNSVR